jgi:glycosyltransferase involved in cell wall biosynthesis
VPDVRPYYSRAQIAIVPLWIGGGTRVKVLEAMAMGVPVVSTVLGCEGLDVRDGRTALIGESDEGLADAAVRALTQPALRRALVADGRALAEEYDWRRVALGLEAAFRVARRRTSRSSIAGISPGLHPVDSTSWTPGAARSAPTTRPSSGAS